MKAAITIKFLIGAVIIAALSQAIAAPHYSPKSNASYPQNLYWGDTHVHTTLSADAFSQGATLTPDNAYRFAKGETITSNTGQSSTINTPLDFIVLTDHAEFLGVFPLLAAQDPLFLDTELGQRWHGMYQQNKQQQVFVEFISTLWGKLAFDYPKSVQKSIWQDITASADRYNEPNKFTAFIGFEWSSLPNGNNLHRNVIFVGDASSANQVLPLSSLDSADPEHLWQYLEAYETKTGSQVLAIAHNGNVSNGLMFSGKRYDGSPLTQSYAKSRARWEPLYEVTQIKGDGEAHPYLSPNDEFADYENWDRSNLSMEQPPKQPWMLKHEYARSALKLGLEVNNELGANPFKFGMIGSSDSHTGIAGVEENNFWGKFGNDEPSATRSSEVFQHSLRTKDYVASGYAAVWAETNTREALFAAMQRRETYATTGPRISVRFFGGWDYADNDHLKPNYAEIGYQKGVPMGGDLSAAPKGLAPQFLVVASKDASGANLDRVQIIKGWLKADGSSAEKVYNVALSDQRKVSRRTGKAKPLPSTVDLKTASYTNSVGAALLSTVWQDPDFDPSQAAFYYVRVLEILTPRWTTYDAAFYNTALPEDVPSALQERAYTSPIWYTPSH